ncbi:MAG: helix-turn-helix domain-containing protein [Bacteroidota bacterium]|nr:helix-turn-helix domain-containing protein [Bacteroidota bacterium]MDX5430650.1 helix-turn-helix domain-containing protein [Bacteroidota bacterium]MDX5469400.1 helix-turn-helix domain-containing protein [Bacteroidota bacterium]
MDISARVNDVISTSGRSKSEMAELLGVSLAQLSHISSGRNKPGLELVQKICTHFPDISAKWLLTGQGQRYEKAVMIEEMNHLLIKTEQKLREMQLELKELELQIRDKRQ